MTRATPRRRLLTTDIDNRTVTRYRPDLGEERSVGFPGTPAGISFHPSEPTAFVTLLDINEVAILDLTTFTVAGTIATAASGGLGFGVSRAVLRCSRSMPVLRRGSRAVLEPDRFAEGVRAEELVGAGADRVEVDPQRCQRFWGQVRGREVVADAGVELCCVHPARALLRPASAETGDAARYIYSARERSSTLPLAAL